jgi:hypothetical protein
MPREKKYPSPAARQRAYRQRREAKRSAQAAIQASVVCSAWRLACAVRKAAAAGDTAAQALDRPLWTDTVDALTAEFEARACRGWS